MWCFVYTYVIMTLSYFMLSCNKQFCSFIALLRCSILFFYNNYSYYIDDHMDAVEYLHLIVRWYIKHVGKNTENGVCKCLPLRDVNAFRLVCLFVYYFLLTFANIFVFLFWNWQRLVDMQYYICNFFSITIQCGGR